MGLAQWDSYWVKIGEVLALEWNGHPAYFCE